MSQSFPIIGIPMPSVPDPQHPIPLRKEVTAWASDPDNAVQLSLFIQALIKFQQMDFQNELSYYGVAGIHGYPAVSWDGAKTPITGKQVSNDLSISRSGRHALECCDATFRGKRSSLKLSQIRGCLR